MVHLSRYVSAIAISSPEQRECCDNEFVLAKRGQMLSSTFDCAVDIFRALLYLTAIFLTWKGLRYEAVCEVFRFSNYTDMRDLDDNFV